MPSPITINLPDDFFNIFSQSQEWKAFMLKSLELILTKAMEHEVSLFTGASKGIPSTCRLTHRNGYRTRRYTTTNGDVYFKIPKLRKGHYHPSFLEKYSRTDKAVISVIQEAYINGVSTRKMELLAKTMGIENLSSSTVSRWCESLGAEVERFKNRPIEASIVYLYLDATYIKIREKGTGCLLVAFGITEEGRREILGFEMVEKESEDSWSAFIQSLQKRGLKGVKLISSDAHAGLKEGIFKNIKGSQWQRCWAHFIRNVSKHIPKKELKMLHSLFKEILDAKTLLLAKTAFNILIDHLEKTRRLKARDVLLNGEADVFTYFNFPDVHWKKIRTSNPLERLNGEIKRRSKSVSIFPNSNSAIRLLGKVLEDQQEAWDRVSRNYMDMNAKVEDNVTDEQLEQALKDVVNAA